VRIALDKRRRIKAISKRINFIPEEDDIQVGLALSGRGFRARLFHLGVIWRLNEIGWLRRIDMITSVFGGSIINGMLAARWNSLNWQNIPGVGECATNLTAEVASPIRAFCQHTIDVSSVVIGFLSLFSTIADQVADASDHHLYGGATLQSLPAHDPGRVPRFLFYATNLQTGSSVRIEQKRFADYKLGEIPTPDLKLARVVGASSAFPPVLSPVYFDFEPGSWRALPGAHLHSNQSYLRRVILTDGGVYDNLGLEAIWDRAETVFVSDASAPFDFDENPGADAVSQLGRANAIMMEQTRALRHREIVDRFDRSEKKGAFWGISTKIGAYGVPNPLAQDTSLTESLKLIRTRLNRFSDDEQGHLINWDYALTDTAVRKYIGVPPAVTAGAWPDPQFPL
jgi:NTE family protein